MEVNSNHHYVSKIVRNFYHSILISYFSPNMNEENDGQYHDEEEHENTENDESEDEAIEDEDSDEDQENTNMVSE